MESIFSFSPCLGFLTFLAKGKISKSISLFLSHTGPKIVLAYQIAGL